MDLTDLRRTISLCKEGINSADQNLIKLTGRNFDKTEPISNQNPRFLNKRRITTNEREPSPNEIKKPRNELKNPPALNSVVQMTKGRTRDDALIELKNKENPKEKERCKRLFGHMMGTLNSIKRESERASNDIQNQTRLKIEKKVEEGNKLINESIQKEQNELIRSKRERQNDLKILNQRYRAAEAFDRWRNEKEKMKGFVRTTRPPFVFYRPAVINDETQLRIDQTAREIDAMIEQRRKKLESEIQRAVKSSESHLVDNRQKSIDGAPTDATETSGDNVRTVGVDNDASSDTKPINITTNNKISSGGRSMVHRSHSPVDSLASEDYDDLIEEVEISMHDESAAVVHDDRSVSADKEPVVKGEETECVEMREESEPAAAVAEKQSAEESVTEEVRPIEPAVEQVIEETIATEIKTEIPVASTEPMQVSESSSNNNNNDNTSEVTDIDSSKD